MQLRFDHLESADTSRTCSDPIKRISLSNTPPSDHIIDLSVSSPHSPISPRPLARNGPSSVHLDKPQTRPNVSGMLDSSDLDRVSTSLLPAGRPLPPTPPPSAAIADSAPQAKKPRLGPPPLPSGPPTVRTLHILLGPEHVEENRPKRFFELVRARELKPPLVKLSPPELREILERMRKVNEIWLRTMAEDDGNLQCLATWLKLFINNPKLFEGSIVNLLWVGLVSLFPLLLPTTFCSLSIAGFVNELLLPVDTDQDPTRAAGAARRRVTGFCAYLDALLTDERSPVSKASGRRRSLPNTHTYIHICRCGMDTCHGNTCPMQKREN